MPTVTREVEQEVIYWLCDECHEVFDRPAGEEVTRCPECGKDAVDELKFPRMYVAPNRQKDGLYGGAYRMHLNQPVRGGAVPGQPREPMPVPAVAVFLGAFVVAKDTELGQYAGKLDAIGILRHLAPHLRSGIIRDITDGDPLNVKDQEKRAKNEEDRRLALLNFQNAHLEITLEETKDKTKRNKKKIVVLKDRKRKWGAIAFKCPWCKKNYAHISGLEDRTKRINAHTLKCKGRPNAAAMETVRKIWLGDMSDEIPQDFTDPRTGETISTRADDPGPYGNGPFVAQ